MNKKFIWLGLSFLLVAAMLLASCATSTKTSASTTTSKPTSTTATTKTTSTTKTTTTVPQTTTASTTTTTGHWWDSLGVPQYGGEMVISVTTNIASFDSVAYTTGGVTSLQNCWCERLIADDWTKDPAVYGFLTNYRGQSNVAGLLAESWEFTDPSTYVIRLRHGIKWQDIAPMNGREFIASDVVWNYHRWLGGGDGFTGPTVYGASVTAYRSLTSITAPDNYTVIFKWSVNNPEAITEMLQGQGGEHLLMGPEAVKLWGDVQDWHHAIGTGPFILKDIVSGSSAYMVRNPNYYGRDERYPQNQLPYIDSLKVLIISDQATARSALRTGKLSALDGVFLQDAQTMKKTNPDILQVSYPAGTCLTLDPRDDLKPFNDIRVREAMQMAINLPDIAANYYSGTCDPWPSSLTSNYLTGWGFPYSQWPQALKDEYAYNPTQAKALLAAANVTLPFHTNVVANASTDLVLAQIVQSEFAAVGINMDIIPMDNTTWNAYARARKQDGMVMGSGGGLGISFEPLRQFQRYQTGFDVAWTNANDPVFDAFYTTAMNATTVDGVKQAVRDANEYVTRHHWAISLLTPRFFGLYQSWFHGYNGQNFSVSGSGAGSPLMLGFYASRFWITKH